MSQSPQNTAGHRKASLSSALVLFLLGSGCLFFSWHNWVEGKKASSTWQTAQGKIISSRVEREFNTGSGQDKYIYFAKVVYGYRVGKDYTGHKFTLTDETLKGEDEARYFVRHFPNGTPVTVYYNPSNPQESALKIHTPFTKYVLFTVLGIFLLIMSIPAMMAAFRGG